ncbi:MAG TPA: NAD(P) transhydrogenase subunit alpha [Acidimicrobiales bacterium]|nr:NAD(P) transhydrogenase subunit alpha [Acidimicrobiales bacterium]
MITDAIDLLVVFALAAFLGFEVISKVPSILHTPLMSGSNAIHGVILVGAMVIASDAQGALQMSLAFVAVFLATLNIVGGVVVTDRMLDMFKGRQPGRPQAPGPGERAASSPGQGVPPSAGGKVEPKP